ncbi:MAG: hypothetical protein GY851_16200 [bacterium]|nr:hypothetical protein [bacterium]
MTASDNLLISTVNRHCRTDEASGHLYEFDVQSGCIVGQCPIIPPVHIHKDTNPRGGVRGAKGLAFHDGHAYITNATAVFRFSAGWRFENVISHPSCAQIHDIAIHDDTLWITSTRNDLLMQFSLDGQLIRYVNMRTVPLPPCSVTWNPRNLLSDDHIVRGTIDFRDPSSHVFERYDAGHLNSVAFLPNGDALVLLGMIWTRTALRMFRLKFHLKRFGLWRPLVRVNKLVTTVLRQAPKKHTEMAIETIKGSATIVRITRDGSISTPYALEETAVPVHSLRLHQDGTIIYCDSDAGAIVRFDPDSGRELQRAVVSDEFLRGLYLSPEGPIYAGSQNHLLIMDEALENPPRSILVTPNKNECVFDIKPIPDGFGPLPNRLEAP